MAERPTASPALRSAFVLAVALLGDALLYLVLPVQASAFGVTAVWVGVLLSANRFIRLVLNQALVPVAQRYGLGGLALLGAALAAASTYGYAVLAGGLALLAARLVWGAAYSALRLAQLGFATDAASSSGRMLGWSHAVVQLGPLVAVTAGAYLATLAGPRWAFAALGTLSCAGLLVARGLVRDKAAPPPPAARRLSFRPSPTDPAAFLLAVAADGVFMVTVSALLLREGHGTQAAIQVGGFVLVARRVAALLLGPVAGRMGDRWGLERLFRVGLGALALGLLAVALGAGAAGLVAVACLMPVAQVLAPGVAAARATPARRLQVLSSYATWSDLGAAVGAFAGGSLVAAVDVRLLYGAAAGLVALGLAVEAGLARRRATRRLAPGLSVS